MSVDPRRPARSTRIAERVWAGILLGGGGVLCYGASAGMVSDCRALGMVPVPAIIAGVCGGLAGIATLYLYLFLFLRPAKRYSTAGSVAVWVVIGGIGAPAAYAGYGNGHGGYQPVTAVHVGGKAAIATMFVTLALTYPAVFAVRWLRRSATSRRRTRALASVMPPRLIRWVAGLQDWRLRARRPAGAPRGAACAWPVEIRALAPEPGGPGARDAQFTAGHVQFVAVCAACGWRGPAHDASNPGARSAAVTDARGHSGAYYINQDRLTAAADDKPQP